MAREAGHAFRRMSRRRMGARRLARVKRDRRAWSGSGSRSRAPSWRGLPTEVRSVLMCPSKVHNKWLSARGDALGTMGATASHGAITEELGAILIHGPQRVVVRSRRRPRHEGCCRLPRGCHGRIWGHACAHAKLVSTWLESQAGPGPVALSGQVPLQESVPLTAMSARSAGLPR